MDNQKLSFHGPAGWTFSSFEEQAEFFLDTFCLGWRDNDNPISHLIPRVFEYTWPEINKEDAIRLQKGNYHQRIFKTRLGDTAEHIVYRAITKCIFQNVAAPFIAICNLKIDGRRRKILQQIFPLVAWEKDLEYDFILIGPKIGLVSLEVKGCEFDNKEDFAETNFHLPKDYKKGLDQSESIRDFLGSLEKCVGIKFPAFSIRNVIFTPHLERKVFESWRGKLPEKHRIAVDRKIGASVQLFKEDMVEIWEDLPSLHQSIKQILETTLSIGKIRLPLPDYTIPLSTQHTEINNEIYEAYAKMFTGFSTVVTIDKRDKEKKLNTLDIRFQQSELMMEKKMNDIMNFPRNGINPSRLLDLFNTLSEQVETMSSLLESLKKIQNNPQEIDVKMTELDQIKDQTTQETLSVMDNFMGTSDNEMQIGLEEDDFCEMMNILMSSDQIQAHNPVKEGKQLEKASAHVPASKVGPIKIQFNKLSVMFLTPEQQAILGGGPNQIISGAPGTGKTVLLQAKALELLSTGESVIAIIPAYLRIQYKSVFEKSGSQNYQIWDWNFFTVGLTQDMDTLAKWGKEILDCIQSGDVSALSNPLFHAFGKNISGSHIIFEEASNVVLSNDGTWYSFLALLAMAKCLNPTHTVWIAWDPFKFAAYYNDQTGQETKKQLEKIGYEYSSLRRVMRSSEEVYRSCHAKMFAETSIPSHDMPISSHKIQGFPPKIDENHFPSLGHAVQHLLTHAWPNFLAKLRNQRLPPNSIGILVSGEAVRLDSVVYALHISFIRQCPMIKVDYSSPFLGESYLLSRMGPLSEEWNQLDMDKTFYSPIWTSDTGSPSSDASVIFCRTELSPSLEWPVVIILSIFPKSMEEHVVKMFRYNAQSRAIITFMEFHYTYDIPTLQICACDVCKTIRVMEYPKVQLASKKYTELAGSPDTKTWDTLMLPGWRDYRNPKNHMIGFDSGETVENEAADSFCKGMRKLVDEGFSAPFVLIKHAVVPRSIFNDVPELRDLFNYDFLIIGRNLGLIAVKILDDTSTATSERENFHIPLTNAVTQLTSFHKCVIFEYQLGIFPALPLGAIRKILYAPNLKRSDLDTWKSGLGKDNEDLLKHIQFIDVILEEDIGYKKTGFLYAYPPLKKNLLNCSCEIPASAYEMLAEFFGSWSLFSKSPLLFKIVADRLQNNELSKKYAQSTEAEGNRKNEEGNLSKNGIELPDIFQLSFTPEQQTVLNGGSRQIIIGASGTGKTLLLQTKALEMLKKGQSVIVLATHNVQVGYKSLFEHNFKTAYDKQAFFATPGKEEIVKYRLESWEQLVEKFLQDKNLTVEWIEKAAKSGFGPDMNLLLSFVSEFVSRELPTGHIFMDEMSMELHFWNDEQKILRWWWLFSLLHLDRQRIIWVVSDKNRFSKTIERHHLFIEEHEKYGFSLVQLKENRRSSKEVQTTCQRLIGSGEIDQSISNPIPGFPPFIFNKYFPTKKEIIDHFLTVDLPDVLAKINDRNQETLGLIVSLEGEEQEILVSCISAVFSDQFPGKEIDISQPTAMTCTREWPIVLILAIFPCSVDPNLCRDFLYQARSRACVTFFELFYTFGEDLLVVERCGLTVDKTDPSSI